MLPLLIQYFNGNKKNEVYLKLCSLIKLLNTNTCNYLHKSHLDSFLFANLQALQNVFILLMIGKIQLLIFIQSIECIPLVLEMFYNKTIEFSEHKLIKPLFICLCGDTASLKPIFDTNKNVFYTYDFLPLCKNLPQCVINMNPTRNGSSPPEIITCFFDIIKILNQTGFIVKYMATECDISFDKIHKDFFDQKVKPLL